MIGCFTCRLRRKKCDEGKPGCKACRHLGLDCEYKRPIWWSNNETRRNQKDQIKNTIKRTKTTEKGPSVPADMSKVAPPSLSHSVPTSDTYSDMLGQPTRASSVDSEEKYGDTFDQALAATPGLYDPYSHHMYTPHFSHVPLYSHSYPYEVDVKTERQMFINDIPTRRDSTISTFSTFVPPPHHATLPSYNGEDWSQQDYYETKQDDWNGEEGLDFNFFDFSHGQQPLQAQSAVIPVDDGDRGLLDHLIQNVLRLIFPILEVNQHGSVKADVILPALETNKAYLHCCLSAAAVHMKSIKGPSESLDGDILRHQVAFVLEVVNALSSDTNHQAILEATLGMISFQCSIGRANEPEKDIPWHQHFQAATELVAKLSLPQLLEDMPHAGVHPPFNMTLTAWIDILGSTMHGRAPTFANTYRNKHLSQSTSGLAELMGCQDSVMYLLSELACLDALRIDKKLDDIAVCSHITHLAQQLDQTELASELPQSPYSSTGAVRPRQLSKNITAIFRKAARVYLCSLVPDYNRYQPATVNLVAGAAGLLQYIPAGPDGFDRALVWPLLICGANSIPTSPFRTILAERIAMMGDAAEQGSFGRMLQVLHEVWRRGDEIATSATLCEVTPVTAGSPSGSITTPTIPGPTPTRNQSVHWRDVMRENGWDYLLI